MDIMVASPPSGGTVRAVTSKSHVHRLLICAALADSDTVVEYSDTSEDIEATVRCLAALKSDMTLDCGESGTTLRLILPVGCALGADFRVIMRGRLPQRTSAPLLDALREHGCRISGKGSDILTCSGKLKSGRFSLPGNVSSQFISGLLLALPLLEGDSELVVTGKTESAPYIDMTLGALRMFGIEVSVIGGVYKIRGSQVYRSPGRVQSEGDWSNAAFWLGAGAVRGCVTCTGLDFTSAQGDKAVLDILERFGASVTRGGSSVTVSCGKLRGIEIDAGNTPDLVPILAVVAAAAQGETVITGAARLRLKESDRLEAVTATLGALGADVTQTRDGLIIRGGHSLKGGVCSSFGDHRIAMAAAVASVLCEGTVTVTGAEAVNKSYPGFWADLWSMGADILEV